MEELLSKLKDALVWAHGDVFDEAKYKDMITKIFGDHAVLATRNEFKDGGSIHLTKFRALINIFSADHLWEVIIYYKKEDGLTVQGNPIKNLKINERDISYRKKKS